MIEGATRADRMSRRVLYALVGAGLSLGAPVGLRLLRWLEQCVASLAWLRGELGTYGYVLCSTLVVFSAFGFALGRAADRLTDLSVRDELTALGNRRHFVERLKAEFARARRYGTPLSLLILDVDSLKELNDREGHRGDLALQRAAAAIRDGSRGSDFGARWGGDEFALLAPDTDAGEAHSLGERIRALVSTTRTREDRTLSVGIATLLPQRSGQPEDWLVQAADRALYEAKQAGKNRVVSHGAG